MANVFKEQRDVKNKPNRNNFDLSFQSHSTFKFGYLYPVFCKRTIPGDSFQINSAFDLKVMPLQFPVQSRMRAHMHFFYVRNRYIWDTFDDYITGVPRQNPIVHPFIARPDSEIQTGSIYDFLNVPTTVVTDSIVSANLLLLGYDERTPSVKMYYSVDSYSSNSLLSSNVSDTKGSKTKSVFAFTISPDLGSSLSSDFYLPTDDTISAYMANMLSNSSRLYFYESSNDDFKIMNASGSSFTKLLDTDNHVVGFSLASNVITSLVNKLESHHTIVVTSSPVALSTVAAFDNFNTPTFNPEGVSFTSRVVSSAGVHSYSSLNIPVYSDHLTLNALPFRAYESIYRAFYANDVWQPLVVNGDKQYNKFCTNSGDGADTTQYSLFKRNYEYDFLTSALPSPQSGPAPLVGMSALGDITLESEDGVTNAHAVLDDNGRITQVSLTSPLASVDHARTLMNIASVGMSINDFRNVNALQKFLEQTLRSGYRYKEYILGHHGVTPKDANLGMPEFLGGFSRDVQVQTIISQADTAGTSGKELGEFGANGRVIGGSEHPVNCYCDDYGWIIGIMCITPTPAYSQLLPKQMIAPRNYLEYQSPEFNNLGMQPIPYTEVAPLQSYLDSLVDPSKRLTDVFGYQRPNYDYVASVDEVHGEFRSTLKDYLINRIFYGRPELGSDFLSVNPEEINDIFINQNPDDDVFIGNLGFQVYAKRPIPRIALPTL